MPKVKVPNWPKTFPAKASRSTLQTKDGLEVFSMDEVTIYVASSLAAAKKAVADLAEDSDGIYGMSYKWRPDVNMHDDNFIAILQISSGDKVVLMQLHLFAHCIPPTLISLWKNQNFTFAVPHWDESHRAKMERSFQWCLSDFAASLIDVEQMATEIGCAQSGFEQLVQHFLHHTYKPIKLVPLSEWDSSTISFTQIKVAVLECLCAEHICRLLQKKAGSSAGIVDLHLAPAPPPPPAVYDSSGEEDIDLEEEYECD